MDRDELDKEHKRRIEEYKEHPMINLTDSINRYRFGDLVWLTKLGCLTKIIIVIFMGILFLYFNIIIK